MSVNAEYNSDSIQVLDDISHIRKRKGMYVGDKGPSSLLSEIIDNAIDESQNDPSVKIIVTVDTKLNKYTVRDFGRGIPHGMKELEDGSKKEILEILMTKSNSGGKFDNGAYLKSAGLNGLGMTVTNALSDYVKVITYRDGKFVSFYSEHGESNKLEYGNSDEHNGTYVEFVPSAECFEEIKVPLNYIVDRCKVANAFDINISLIVDEKEIDVNSEIFDLMKKEDDLSVYSKLPVMKAKSDNGEEMIIAMEYTSSTADKYFGYTNLLPNPMGGSHVNSAYWAIVDTWLEFVESHKNLKPSVTLMNNDYMLGVRMVVACFIMHPEFSSQTKEKLSVKKNYFDDLYWKMREEFKKVLESDLPTTTALLKRFEEYRIAQNKLLSRKEISSLIHVNNEDSNSIRRRSVVSKLLDCKSNKREGTELFICEGDSAKQPFLANRNRETQAVLPLRGKILNVTYKDLEYCIKRNSEICDIANSIGANIGPSCDASKSRYERIIISADADVDGEQIASLVLSVFINMFPDLIRKGLVYISVPPLYNWGTSSKDFGWCNNAKDIPQNAKNVRRFKGLGEMNDDEIEYFLINPNTRNTIKVDYPSDVDAFNHILGSSAGKGELMRDLGLIEEWKQYVKE